MGKRSIISMGLIIIFAAIGIYILLILPNKHDHYASSEDSFPGHKILELNAKIVNFFIPDERNPDFGILIINTDGEEFRLYVREETVIKNRMGWPLDISAISSGQQITACVGTMIIYEPIITYNTCYEIWIQ